MDNRRLSAEAEFHLVVSCLVLFILFSLTMMSPSSSPTGAAVIPISSCANLSTSSSEFTLTTDVTSTGTCFNITADNVTLDCDGFRVGYGSSGADLAFGVEALAVQNATVKDCFFSDDSAAGGSGFGIVLTSTQHSIILNNTIQTNATDHGIGIVIRSFPNPNNNIIDRNNIFTQGSGQRNIGIMELSDGTNNFTRNTIFTNGTIQNYGFYYNDSDATPNIFSNNISTNGSGGENYGMYFDEADPNAVDNRIYTDGVDNNYGVAGYLFFPTQFSNNTIKTFGSGQNNSGFFQNFLSATPTEAPYFNNYIVTNGTSNNHGIHYLGGGGLGQFGTNIIITDGSDSHAINLDSTFNYDFNGNNLTTHGDNSYGIHLTGTAINSRYNLTTLINPTKWINTSVGGTNTFRNLSFQTTHGDIILTESFSIGSSTHVIDRSNVNISANRAFINTTNLSFFNTTANITLNNLGFGSAKVQVDFEDDGSFVDCASTQCSISSFASGILKFNVSSFTSYQGASSSVCGDITTDTTLTANQSSSSTCINITADDVVLDCDGFYLIGPGSGNSEYGIKIESRSNITVKNCFLQDWGQGIRLRQGVNDSLFFNNTFIENDFGIAHTNANPVARRNTYVFNNITNSSSVGLFMVTESDTLIANNTFVNNGLWGLRTGSSDPATRSNITIANNTFLRNGLASYTIDFFDSGWKTAFVSHFRAHYQEQTFTLPAATTQVRITHEGTDTAHIDSILLDGQPPMSATDTSTGQSISLSKINSFDFDVIDAAKRSLVFTFTTPGTQLSLAAVEEDTGGGPHVYPGHKFMTYTLGSPKTYVHEWFPSTSHPTGTIYDTFDSNDTHLIVVSDVTSDNTLDYGGDWAEIRLKSNGALKTYVINSTFTQWGTSAYTYTDKVSYQHKVYSFAIPLTELGGASNIEFKMAYYGTSADPPQGGINFEQTNAQFISNNFLQGNRNGLISTNSFVNIVQNNTILDSTEDGIELSTVSLPMQNNTFRFNTVINATRGLDIEGDGRGMYNQFFNNSLLNVTTGIQMDSATNNSFFGTVLQASTNWVGIGSTSLNTSYERTTFKTENGSIEIFDDFVINQSSSITTTQLNITFNRAFLNSSSLGFLNRTGEVTLTNLPFQFASIRVDEEDDGTFVSCPSSKCTEIGFTGGILEFNVTDFTTFIAQGGCPGSVSDNITLTGNLTDQITGVCIDVQTSDTTIDCDGHTIFGNFSGTAIESDNPGLRVVNCQIRNWSTGVNAPMTCDNGFVAENTFGTIRQSGFSAVTCDNYTIANNSFTNVGGGIGYTATASNTAFNVTISNNSIINASGTGIGLGEAFSVFALTVARSDIINNYVLSASTGISDVGASSNFYDNNSLVNISDTGMSLSFGGGTNVSNLNITGFGGGISFSDISGVKLENVSIQTNSTSSAIISLSEDPMSGATTGNINFTNLLINATQPTWFSAFDIPGRVSFTNLTVANQFGQIIFLETFNLGNDTYRTDTINLSTNRIFVNTSKAPFLNTTANLTMFGITNIPPIIQVDFEDDETFDDCVAPQCFNESTVGTTLRFLVASFTTYLAGTNATPAPAPAPAAPVLSARGGSRYGQVYNKQGTPNETFIRIEETKRYPPPKYTPRKKDNAMNRTFPERPKTQSQESATDLAQVQVVDEQPQSLDPRVSDPLQQITQERYQTQWITYVIGLLALLLVAGLLALFIKHKKDALQHSMQSNAAFSKGVSSIVKPKPFEKPQGLPKPLAPLPVKKKEELQPNDQAQIKEESKKETKVQKVIEKIAPKREKTRISQPLVKKYLRGRPPSQDPPLTLRDRKRQLRKNLNDEVISEIKTEELMKRQKEIEKIAKELADAEEKVKRLKKKKSLR